MYLLRFCFPHNSNEVATSTSSSRPDASQATNETALSQNLGKNNSTTNFKQALRGYLETLEGIEITTSYAKSTRVCINFQWCHLI